MRILIVGSLNSHAGKFATFIVEQADALRQAGCDVEYFGITGKGIKGYLCSLKELRGKIEEVRPDIIHAHYGLCGLVAGLAISPFRPFSHLAHRPKLVTTYHGSDINVPSVMRFSKIAMRLSAWNILVSQRTQEIAFAQISSSVQEKCSLVPCGINLPKPASELLDMKHILEPGKKHILFAGAFDNAVKDPQLAKLAVEELRGKIEEPVQLVELKGFSRDEVNALMYACDAFLMTSKTEGSPQVIKEAMACGLPIVSVDVGDVRERLTISPLNHLATSPLLDGCYVADSRDPEEIAKLLMKALAFGKRTDGRKLIDEMGLRNEEVAKKLVEIYKNVI